MGPDGSIYPCYRFVGMPEYVMGSVYDHPSMDDLSQSDAWKLMHQFKDYVDTECKDCPYINFCRGGCPYNAIVPNKGEVKGVDPHCTAYKMIFKEITDRINQDFMGSSGTAMNPFQSEPAKDSKPGIMSLIFRMM